MYKFGKALTVRLTANHNCFAVIRTILLTVRRQTNEKKYKQTLKWPMKTWITNPIK